MSSTRSPLATALRNPWSLAALTGAAVALSVFTGRRARQAEKDFPPIGDFIDVEGTRVHYVELGEGPVVVLLHGNAVSLQDFIASDVFDQLSRTCRVVALDCPGFGYTGRSRTNVWTAAAQARVVEGALTALGIQRCTLVAHSWSTLIALSMALEHPQRVQGLVLVSGYYYPSARLDVPMAALPAIPVLGDALRYTFSGLAARLMLTPALKAMFSPAPVPADYGAAVPREMMLRPSQMRASAEDAALMIPAARALSRRYGELQMPVTIFAGADDKVVKPAGQSMRLHQDVPQSQLHVLPKAGHMVHHAVPERIVAAVNDMQPPVLRPLLQVAAA